MRRILQSALLLLLLINTCEAGIRMEDGSLVDAGDNIYTLYQQWGKEDLRLVSEKTCNHIISLKERFCSKRRLIWQRDGRYIMVQVYGWMIIKTSWTRSERALKDAF